MESYSNGDAPYWTNTKRVRWVKMLIMYRLLKGVVDDATAPQPVDPIWRIQAKLLTVLNI